MLSLIAPVNGTNVFLKSAMLFFGVFQFRPDFVDRLHVILDAQSADIG
jgi:hypothetical protein